MVDFNPRDFLLDYFMNKTAEDEVYDLTFGSKEWEELDAGRITRAAANRIMLENAARSGRTFEVQTVINEWEKILRTNKDTVKIMMQLKLAGFNLYYCSNIASDTFEQIKQREFFLLFDGGIASCDVHINKPDPQIYTMLMQKYHLVYEETIFVDDNRANAQAAYNLGLHHRHPVQKQKVLYPGAGHLRDSAARSARSHSTAQAGTAAGAPAAAAETAGILAATKSATAMTDKIRQPDGSCAHPAAGFCCLPCRDLLPDTPQGVFLQPADLGLADADLPGNLHLVFPARYRSRMIFFSRSLSAFTVSRNMMLLIQLSSLLPSFT